MGEIITNITMRDIARPSTLSDASVLKALHNNHVRITKKPEFEADLAIKYQRSCLNTKSDTGFAKEYMAFEATNHSSKDVTMNLFQEISPVKKQQNWFLHCPFKINHSFIRLLNTCCVLYSLGGKDLCVMLKNSAGINYCRSTFKLFQYSTYWKPLLKTNCEK